MNFRSKSSGGVVLARTTLGSLTHRTAMSLQPRRPPGHAKRKALAYSADILNLRRAGHSLSAIREALEDAGILVSISTVRREVLKGASTTPACKPAPSAPQSPGDNSVRRAAADVPSPVPHPAPAAAPLPGRAVAEEFMRGHSTNTLFLEEPPI